MKEAKADSKTESNHLGQCTPEEIAKLKEANPRGVYQIKIENNRTGKFHYGYFKKPNRLQMDFATAEASKDKKFSVDRFNQALFNNCWIAGDEKIKIDEDLFMSAVSQFGALAKVFDAEIKEL